MSFINKIGKIFGTSSSAPTAAASRSVAKERLSVILAAQRGTHLLEGVNMEALQRDVMEVVQVRKNVSLCTYYTNALLRTSMRLTPSFPRRRLETHSGSEGQHGKLQCQEWGRVPIIWNVCRNDQRQKFCKQTTMKLLEGWEVIEKLNHIIDIDGQKKETSLVSFGYWKLLAISSSTGNEVCAEKNTVWFAWHYSSGDISNTSYSL